MATPLKKKMPTKKKVIVTKTGEKLSENWCRVEMKLKPATEFYQATDSYIDKSGLMSVCKGCLNDIYSKFYQNDNSVEKTLLRMCRMLNVRYDERAVESTRKQLLTMMEKRTDVNGVFGIYRQKLYAVQNNEIGKRNDEDLTYVDVSGTIKFEEIDYTGTVERDVVSFWGNGYKPEDYAWLENEYDEWIKTHKSDTKAEQVLLKEIVYKQFEIKKARTEDKATGSLTKELQDLMKTASYDPAKTSVAGSGKAHDTFSAFIKTIEENEPAEYYKDENLFKDYANIDKYFQKYIVRPLKNFVTGSRDFNIDDVDNDVEDDFEDEEFDKFKTSLEEDGENGNKEL